jgi:hypothetical protein
MSVRRLGPPLDPPLLCVCVVSFSFLSLCLLSSLVGFRFFLVGWVILLIFWGELPGRFSVMGAYLDKSLL